MAGGECAYACPRPCAKPDAHRHLHGGLHLTTTGTGTVTAGGTDIGNHCDDCSTRTSIYPSR